MFIVFYIFFQVLKAYIKLKTLHYDFIRLNYKYFNKSLDF